MDLNDVIVHIDKLSDSVKELASASLLAAAEQRAYVDAEKHAMKRRTRLEKFVLAGLTAMFVGLVANSVGLWLVFDSQQATRDAQRTNHQTLAAIKDCTDPSGKCAQRGQQATAAAVTQINEAATVAAWCAAHSQTLAATRACVTANS